jgi:hypothetical protein
MRIDVAGSGRTWTGARRCPNTGYSGETAGSPMFSRNPERIPDGRAAVRAVICSVQRGRDRLVVGVACVLHLADVGADRRLRLAFEQGHAMPSVESGGNSWCFGGYSQRY